jgi:hypothetical protein
VFEFFGTVNELVAGGQHDGPDLVRAGWADQFAHSPARDGDRVCRQGEDVYLASWVVLKTSCMVCTWSNGKPSASPVASSSTFSLSDVGSRVIPNVLMC